MLIGEDKFAAFNDAFAEHVVCKPFGKSTHVNVNGIMEETKAFRYGKIAALDVFATTAAATLLYIGSRIFADRQSKERDMTPQDANPSAKNIPETPAPAEDCLPCRLKSYTSEMVPSAGFAQAIVSEKAKAAESQPMQAV